MKNITFDGWKLMGTLPWQPDFSKWMSDGEMYPGLTDWIDASVPGCVYQDLFRAGLIDDPYFGVNSLACEWVANRWWLYRTSFSLTEDDLGEHLELTFHGIDYAAKIYLNGQLLGEHEGMFIPFSACINEAARPGKNVLVCVLEHAPFCAPQPGYTSKTHYLKSRFNYKWDFAARLVSLGLYDQVTLTAYPLASISGAYIRPVRHEEQWTLEIDLSVTSYRTGCAELSLSLSDPSGHPIPETPAVALSLSEGLSEYHFSIQVKEPLLWWPNGYGDQPLYRLQARLLENGILSDEKSWNTGFRTLSYFHADGREDALAYGVCINGRRIYLKGTNIVPFDCMTGAVTRQKLHSQLGAAKDANINFFRIWGGGNIESEAFYELCDEMGILVMQEFTMSSSGCDDVPSRDPHFIALLERALTSQLPIKRNHLCLTFLCGGKKLAWYAMRDAYAPVLASLRYDSLFYAPGERFEASLSLLSDLPDCRYTVTCTVTDQAGCSLLPGDSRRLDFCGSIRQDQVISFEPLMLDLPETITGSFSVRIHTECGDFSNDKEYLFLIADKDLPLELRPEEESQIQERKGKGLANGLYDKRADVRSVLAYVKRLEQSVSET